MKKSRGALRLAIMIAMAIPTASAAQIDGIQNHEVQTLFMDAPCGQAITRMDTPKVDIEGIGKMTMAFGFLMGFEATHPGIRGDQDTILKRLRADCATRSDATAMDLLNSYVIE